MGCGSLKSAHKSCPSVYEPLGTGNFADTESLQDLLMTLLQPPPSPASLNGARSMHQLLRPVTEESELQNSCPHSAMLSC